MGLEPVAWWSSSRGQVAHANSQVTHYLFEGAFAYHTPMRTEGEEEFWTTPDRIE